MAFKRISASILLLNEKVVKSYGFDSFKPAGNLKSIMITLDRWGVDEIYIIDISRDQKVKRSTLKTLTETRVSTPIIYGGGIKTLNDAKLVIESGCDRIIVEDIMMTGQDTVKEIANKYGQQCIIGCLPISIVNNETIIPEYLKRKLDNYTIERLLKQYMDSPISEILIIDHHNEGVWGGDLI